MSRRRIRNNMLSFVVYWVIIIKNDSVFFCLLLQFFLKDVFIDFSTRIRSSQLYPSANLTRLIGFEERRNDGNKFIADESFVQRRTSGQMTSSPCYSDRIIKG